MLKRNYIIFIVVIIGVFLIVLLTLLNLLKTEKNFIFTYPEWEINFSLEVTPFNWRNYFNKKKFDKEFLISSNNLFQFYLYIKRYPIYIPYIEKELKEAWIPDDFKYLAIAESALRDDVVSNAWAAWIWQFMPETAKRFDLIINEYVDERYNFMKSTQAAIIYINFLYNKFWSRTLAAAAYNRWEWWIEKALLNQDVTSYYDLYLNEETSRYVFRILAIKYLIEDYFDKKGIIDHIVWWVYVIPNTKIVKVNEISNIMLFAKQNGTTYKTLKLLNPWILWNSLPEWEREIILLK